MIIQTGPGDGADGTPDLRADTLRRLRASVLVPSFRRVAALERCLRSLGSQTRPPHEIVVVWQGDDVETRNVAETLRDGLRATLVVVHLSQPGIVPAENAALAAATGDIIFLIDDDAIAPPDWIARHTQFYLDPKIGAVGGPANNFEQDGTPYPVRAVEPVGRLTWYGKAVGNLHNHVPEWVARAPQPGESLVGYNMSLRRTAFDRFEERLKPYWQYFELDACLQVKSAGFEVLVDFGNVVRHFPTNPAYAPGRHGDLALKVYHAAYNHSFVLAKHSHGALRLARMAYLLLVGSVVAPGFAAFFVAVRRYGHPLREARILTRAWRYTIAGWRAGTAARAEELADAGV